MMVMVMMVVVVVTENNSVIANCHTISNYYKRNEHGGNSAVHRSNATKPCARVGANCGAPAADLCHSLPMENAMTPGDVFSRLARTHSRLIPKIGGELFQMEQQIRRPRLPDGHGEGYRCESRERRGSREEDVSLSAEWSGKSMGMEVCPQAVE